MFISKRKFRMKRLAREFLLLFLIIVPSVWWIYSKCFNSMLQEDEWDKWKQMEDEKWTKIEEDKRTKIETISNYIEENEIYPIDIRHVLVSIRRKSKEDLRQEYEDDQKYVKGLKEMIQGKKIEEDKRANIEMISSDTEESETYPIDIRHIPASIRRKNEKSLGQAYTDDHKYLKALKEMLKGDESSRDINFEDDFLRLFIRSNDYKIDEAFLKIQNFLNLRANHNYFFHNMSFDFTQNPAYRFVTILPHRRKDGSATMLFELAKWDPDIVPLEHLKKIMFIIGIQELRNPVTQASGWNLIFDFKDAGFRYLKYGTPQNIFLLHHVAFEVMPAKFVGYHLVNLNVIGNSMLTISRLFLPKYIEDVFFTHASGKALLDFFPSSMLPVQYGGNLTEYYAAEWIRKANQQHGKYPTGGQKNIF